MVLLTYQDFGLLLNIYGVFAQKSMSKPNIVRKRDFRSFDKVLLVRDMELDPWGNILTVVDHDICNKVTIFENILNKIIDKHITCRTFRVTRLASPWLNEDIYKNL